MLRLLATSFLLMTYLLGMTLSVQATVKLEAVGASPDITEPSMFKKKGKYDNRSYPYPSPVTVKIRNLYKTNSELEVATFAGGGFWGVEAEFEKMPGVREVFSGFMGGHVDNPTYRQVSDGSTGHYEVVEIYYDPKRVSYSQLTEKLWRISNPTNSGGGGKIR